MNEKFIKKIENQPQQETEKIISDFEGKLQRNKESDKHFLSVQGHMSFQKL